MSIRMKEGQEPLHGYRNKARNHDAAPDPVSLARRPTWKSC